MPKKIKQEDIDRMVELYEEGYSMAEIGRLLNLSRNTISKYLKEEGKEPIELKSEMEEENGEEVIGVPIKEEQLVPFEVQRKLWLLSEEYNIDFENLWVLLLKLINFCEWEQVSFEGLFNLSDWLKEYKKEIERGGISLGDFCSEIKSIKLLKQLIENKKKEMKALENTKNIVIQMAKEVGKNEMSDRILNLSIQTKLLESLQGQKRAKQQKEDDNFMETLLYSRLLPEEHPTSNKQTPLDLTLLEEILEEQEAEPETQTKQPTNRRPQKTIGETLRENLKKKGEKEKA